MRSRSSSCASAVPTWLSASSSARAASASARAWSRSASARLRAATMLAAFCSADSWRDFSSSLSILSAGDHIRGHGGAFDPRANLGESGVAGGRRIIAERSEATVVRGSHLLDRNVFRGLQHTVADLLGCVDARVYRRDNADKNLLARPHELLDDLQHLHAILLARERNTEVAHVELEE